MILQLKYFGMVAESIGKTEEKFDFSQSITTLQLKEFLFSNYTILKSMHFRVAVNLALTQDDFIISIDSEVALLPAFAGG